MVHIITVGGVTSSVRYSAGATIAKILEAAGINADGFEVKYNGVRATSLDQTVSEDGTILLTRRVKGA
jgi:sulfur carrier protein ThiS